MTLHTAVTSKVTTYNHWAGDAGANAFSSQGYRVGDAIHVSGQYSCDMEGNFVGGDIEAQVRRTLGNLDRVLEGLGAGRSNIAEVVLYMTDAREHIWTCAELFREYIGEHRPAITGLGVTYLAFPEQLFEIRAVAYAD